VRLDSGVAAGSIIPGQYDSLIAKLIITGKTREDALKRARRALAEFRIEGPATVLPFHRAVLEHPDFTGESGFAVHTRWIETEFQADFAPAPRPDPVEDDGFLRMPMEIDGKRHEIGLPRRFLAGLSSTGPAQTNAGPAPATGENDSAVKAPITGSLQAWKVADKAEVQAGELLATMEAMKMEVQILAPRAGTIRLNAAAGASLTAGDLIAMFE
ncbi:MAG TPA: biotin/lipoyl-containing protein, partial [Acidocella sp.]|nr:biotin/lipoyl-containing protein [Acidocella sp.]